MVIKYNSHAAFKNSTASRIRSHLLCTAGTFIIGFSVPAYAQNASPADQGAGTPVSEDIIVTGSRIVSNGYDAPTPVSVISTKELAAEAPANIADFVNTLPSVSGSQTPVSNSGSLSNGQSGISALNLRSLGQNRTLVLFDGQRSVASTSTGIVDLSTFPQALIERVEVVTGGASSVYGSDAVAGVVNFILDKKFTGLKASYEYGVTTYGDVPNHKVSLTGGMDFAGGRGHVLLSGEYFTQKGVDTIARDWNKSGFFQVDNPDYTDTNGQPKRLVMSGIGSGNLTPGGLITSGPLRGTYFGAIDPATGKATTGELAYGQTTGSWMIGGDYELASANHVSSNSLANDEDRRSFFGRASYDFSDAFSFFVQASYSRYEGESYYQQTPSTGVQIMADNAYLPDSIRAAMAANNLSSITIGTSNAGIPAAGANNKREVQRYVAGGNGVFSTGAIDWTWDGYFQHGKTKTREHLVNTWQNDRLAEMQDAVYDGSGNIVCRSTLTDPGNGCVPINRIGVGGVTAEALDYLFAIYPERKQYITQDVGGLNFATKNLFNGWAGPISLAFGAEARKEKVDGYTDPINYETRWLYGNYKVTKGSYNVKEAYVETLVPLYDGLDFNGALRVTDYSTSGTATTWKLGLTYQPVPDIRLRGTVSRDIRAPNLSELFDPGTARTNSVNVPDASAPGGARADQFVQNFTGSTDLKPEVAKTYGAGVIITPRFLPGFAFSADYFDIKLSDAISSVSAQTTVNLCFEQNIQSFCDNIRYTAGSSTNIEFIDLKYFNFASQKTNGIDFEASYNRIIGPGKLSLRGLATYTIHNITNNGIDAPNDAAGVGVYGGIPSWSYRITGSYAFDSGFTVGVVGRGLSSGVYDNDYIACTANCPASDPSGIQRTINTNHIDGALYIDTNFTYDFQVGSASAQAVLSIKNLFDTDPVLVGNGPFGNNTSAYPQTNRGLYDTLGRTFRLGLRVKL
ncbi:TonB-dependent receptor domain-containing protein [Novosphingobium beihaiensis]|uniref:TonB-dependent receptor n=1 Tax=Novosphingobium beihaiensis TaxID=2930389 RepID=A0ABT0BRS8_9SPHN|nr:TonB-dependent receptor [Novosphingobium beihaiensis]MCJ2187673.1 TonB-dependent receptor [Novosphingobium beihaiensis]